VLLCLIVSFAFLPCRCQPSRVARRSCGQGDFHWDDPESSGFIDSECADLNLFNARIGDDGAKALSLAIINTDAELESINLRDNRISDEGAVALAAAMAQNKHVRSLQLRGNDIGDRGATAIAGALHTNTVLTGTLRCWLP
jgi:Ran GTPase-activating protein (RanGAP) involved in mRNA processing and transport